MHDANHAPIIDRETWDAVQQMLACNTAGERPAKHSRNRSLLAGRLADEDGEPLIATHACNGKVRYRYYVSRALQHDAHADPGSGMRIPAREIEAAVAEQLAEALDDPIALTARAGLTLHSSELRHTMTLAEDLAGQFRAKDYHIFRRLVSGVRVSPREVSIDLAVDVLAEALKLEINRTRRSRWSRRYG